MGYILLFHYCFSINILGLYSGYDKSQKYDQLEKQKIQLVKKLPLLAVPFDKNAFRLS